MDRMLVDIFLQAQSAAPKEIVLDLDSTDIPLHGEQEDRFFHGYYGHYCYQPLYIVCGEHVLCARLRPSNIDGAKGSVAEVERIVAQIRQAWPQVRIIVRGDSGFCRDQLLSWCEEHGVDYVVGLAQNARLLREIAAANAQAREPISADGKGGAGVHRICLSHEKELVAIPAGHCQGGALGERKQSTVRGHLAEPGRNHRFRTCPFHPSTLAPQFLRHSRALVKWPFPLGCSPYKPSVGWSHDSNKGYRSTPRLRRRNGCVGL